MNSEELGNDIASLIPEEWSDFLSLYKQAKEKQRLGVSLTAQEKQSLIDLQPIAAEIDG